MIGNTETLLTLILAVPALGGLGVLAFGRSPNLREAITLVTACVLLFLVIELISVVGEGARPELTLAHLGPNLTLGLKAEPLGVLFAAVASGLWIVNSLYSIGYMRGNKEKDQTRFFFLFTVAIASAMGIALSGDLITMFVFYEVLTISTYPLVAHKGDEKARKGARIYLMILMGTSLGFLLPAIIGTFVLSGGVVFTQGGLLPNDVAPVAAGGVLLLFAFGVGKAALMPVHSWLPNAMVAPTPVSALLHAVAVVKAGVFVMLKLAVYVFGADLLQGLGAAKFVAVLAGLSIVLASVIALSKDNLKARLAFSTVSQLSYVTLGAMLATPAAWLGAALQIVMHAYGKITLFMCAGAIYTATKKTEISDMVGLGKSMPWVFGAYTIGALSIIGLPPLAGAWPKLELMLGAVDAEFAILAGALALSSVLNVAYLLPLAARGFYRAQAEGAEPARGAPLLAVLPPVLTAIACALLFVFVGRIVDFVSPAFDVPAAASAPLADGGR